MRNLVEVARAAVARKRAAEQMAKEADQVRVVVVPTLPAQQPTPWPGYRRWRIRRANGEDFGVFVPRGATIAEMTAFYCGCVCTPEIAT